MFCSHFVKNVLNSIWWLSNHYFSNTFLFTTDVCNPQWCGWISHRLLKFIDEYKRHFVAHISKTMFHSYYFLGCYQFFLIYKTKNHGQNWRRIRCYKQNQSFLYFKILHNSWYVWYIAKRRIPYVGFQIYLTTICIFLKTRLSSLLKIKS